MNVFTRPGVRYGATPALETPYQRAAQAWDDRIGSARVQARNWRLMAFGSLLLSAGLSGALVWQGARGSVTPWVVEVDRLGQTQAVAPAVAGYKPADPQIAWHLARFVEEVRSIPRIVAPWPSTNTPAPTTPSARWATLRSPSTSRA